MNGTTGGGAAVEVGVEATNKAFVVESPLFVEGLFWMNELAYEIGTVILSVAFIAVPLLLVGAVIYTARRFDQRTTRIDQLEQGIEDLKEKSGEKQ